MTKTLKRLTVFLLVFAVCTSMIPSAFAADNTSTGTVQTEGPEKVAPAESVPVDSEEDALFAQSMSTPSADENISTYSTDELNGYPTDFCHLWLEETVHMEGGGFSSNKNRVVLYAMHLTNQPGYETNYYVAYCIEPGIAYDYNETHGGNSYLFDDLSGANGILSRLDEARVRAIGVALLYGQKEIARKADEESVRIAKLCRHAATQVIIWEIACGWREAVPPYKCNNNTMYDAINKKLEMTGTVWGTSFWVDGVADAYNDIASKMAKHYTIPSFAADQLSFAPTYTMNTSSAGQYSITLTDTNNILSAYTFADTENVKYSVNGNQLTVTVTGDVTWPLTVSPTKQIPDISKQVFYVWQNGNAQRMLSSFSEPTNDPVPCYFKLKVSNGSLSLKKTTEDGQNLAGWQFGIYSDAACTQLISGPHTSDANGAISVTGLTAGDVWVKELGNTDAAINAKYYCSSQNPQKVTITAGGTATVTFENKLNLGVCQIIKKATNGGAVNGWHFTVKDAFGNTVGSYVTDASGIIALNLLPGTYTVVETDGKYEYWSNDPNPTKTVTVKANETASVTFTNSWFGKAQIVKTATNGGSVSGWHFEVRDSSGNVVGNYTTDTTGIITIDLEPGTYTVVETDGAYPYWHNDPNPTKTVTVKAGETAKVTFTNQWIGKAQIIKTATNGGSVAGWHFEVRDASGNVVGSYVTDSTGIITIDLQPGDYTVVESDGEYPYWHNDPNPSKSITVKAGETSSVTFENQWVGKAKIVKVLSNSEAGTVAGWTFTIHKLNGSDAQYVTTVTTGEDGTITYDLEPGDYLITEELAEDSIWECTSGISQTITVTAGQTAEVSFTNALRPGKIQVHKVDTQGQPLAGVEFLLEWSTDGVNWQPVTFTDATAPQIGGCTTEGVTDGKLKSDASGAVVFEGLYPLLQYRLTETATLDGYQLLTGPAYEGELPLEKDFTVTLTVVNAEVFTLPKTGSKSLVLMPIALVLCLATCAGALVLLRKKDGR